MENRYSKDSGLTSVAGKPSDRYPALDQGLVCNGWAQKKLRVIKWCGLFLLSTCRLQEVTEAGIKSFCKVWCQSTSHDLVLSALAGIRANSRWCCCHWCSLRVTLSSYSHLLWQTLQRMQQANGIFSRKYLNNRPLAWDEGPPPFSYPEIYSKVMLLIQ